MKDSITKNIVDIEFSEILPETIKIFKTFFDVIVFFQYRSNNQAKFVKATLETNKTSFAETEKSTYEYWIKFGEDVTNEMIENFLYYEIMNRIKELLNEPQKWSQYL